MAGASLLMISLVVCGFQQGLHDYNFAVALPALRISTLGLFVLLLGALLFAANVFAMTVRWKLELIKTIFNAVIAPLVVAEVKS
jgi:hypothetical protein